MGKRGGNRKPQTFRPCNHCSRIFGPLSRLSTKFCSMACKAEGQRKAIKKPPQRKTAAASRAQRHIRYLVEAGKIIKPNLCEECGLPRPIEAAHHDYKNPIHVKWLCRSCHRRWDWAEPKGGTERPAA